MSQAGQGKTRRAHTLLVLGLGALLGLPGAIAGGGEQVAQAPAQPRAPSPGRGAPRYLPASELDTRPQIMTHVQPEYPAELVSGTRGRVVLELYIAQDGTLDRLRVARAEPAGRFEASALKAFSGARFTPAMKKGKPVPSLMRIEVTYGD